MNVDQLLAQRKLEIFTMEGKAPDVVMADQAAWRALENVLGGDPLDRWVLKGMQHIYDAYGGTGGGVVFKAEFVRTPDDE